MRVGFARLVEKNWTAAAAIPACVAIAVFALVVFLALPWAKPEIVASQNTAFSSAMNNAANLKAFETIRDDRFVSEIAKELKNAANDVVAGSEVLASVEEPETVAPAAEAPKTDAAVAKEKTAQDVADKKRAWLNEYVCGIKDWGEHEGVIRALVARGYAECGSWAAYTASAPAFVWTGSVMIGLFILALLLTVIALSVRFAIHIGRVRQQWHYLFSSHLNKQG